MKKEFNLSEKSGWVNSYEIRDQKDCHISHEQEIFEVEDVKEFIKLERVLIGKAMMNEISWFEFFKERNKLVGDDFKS